MHGSQNPLFMPWQGKAFSCTESLQSMASFDELFMNPPACCMITLNMATGLVGIPSSAEGSLHGMFNLCCLYHTPRPHVDVGNTTLLRSSA